MNTFDESNHEMYIILIYININNQYEYTIDDKRESNKN
jgi:hypothetical protein